MRKSLQKYALLISMVLLLAVLFTFSTGTAFAASANSPWSGTTTGWANVRSGPSTGSAHVGTDAPNTQVAVYATVSGQIVWGGISAWYRVSSLSSAPRYIYSGLVAHSSSSPQPGSGQGRLIIVSLSHQSMTVYDNGHQVYYSLVTTGRPELYTPTGTFHIFRKLRNVTFYSPWPKGSPYYYAPEHVNYALQITWNGIFLHDATWRSVFGPGTNVWHKDPKFGWMTGSHGCVNLPLSSAAWLYNWATIGTTVQIVR